MVAFNIISATTDRIQAPFRFSGPTHHPSSPAKAKKVPPRESETAILNVALLSMQSMKIQYFAVFSATADRIRAPFRFSGPIRHRKSPTKAENIPPLESETAILNAALLSKQSMKNQCFSIISATAGHF